MSLNRSLDDLVPEMKEKVEKFLFLLKRDHIKVMINETRRSKEVQEAYYAQGRESFEKINELRVKAGLWKIGPIQAGKKVTWTLQSKHIEGKAIDIVPLAPDGKPWWDAPPKVWEALGMIGETCGLTWGGRWKVKDLPHYEI